MTYKPHYDRTDWRSLSTKTLIEAAQDCPHELAIALGERLGEMEGFDAHAADLEKENADLRHQIDTQERVITDLYADIETLAQTIAEHEAALGYDQ
jgi:peptidoglycan hydrolase CwlO-like protein